MRKNKLINNYMDLAILLNFIAFFVIRNIPILFWIFQAYFLVSALLYCRGKKINYGFTLYGFLFLSWTLLSFLWAESLPSSIKFLKEILQILVICSGLFVYCDSKEKIEKTLDLLGIALIFTLAYLFIRTPLSEWRNIYYYKGSIASAEGRLGYTIGVHPNEMGYLCAIACLLFFYKFNTRKSKKIISGILMLVYFGLLLFTKSRASLLCAIAFIGVFWLFKQDRKKSFIIKLVTALILSIGILWSLLNIKPLYNLVGYRFEGLVGIFNSDYEVDDSTTGREILIKTGINIFKDHPFIGVGAGNYAYKAYNYYGTWREVFAHSNFIELLADLGIIGFLIYYIPRIWCIVYLYKGLKTENKNYRYIYTMLFSFCFVSFVFDYIKISYNKDYLQLVFLVSFAAATLTKIDLKKSKKIELNEKS